MQVISYDDLMKRIFMDSFFSNYENYHIVTRNGNTYIEYKDFLCNVDKEIENVIEYAKRQKENE